MRIFRLLFSCLILCFLAGCKCGETKIIHGRVMLISWPKSKAVPEIKIGTAEVITESEKK